MPAKGRTPVLDEGRRREIVAILSVGCTRRAAADYVGCSVTTILRTARRNPDFAEAIRRAESASQVATLTKIQKAADKPQYWRAAAWLLERRHPDDFARRGPDVITRPQLRELMSRLASLIVEEVTGRTRKRLLKRLFVLIRSLAARRRPKAEGPKRETP